jgi:CBS domain containing-hemolysin-like protein
MDTSVLIEIIAIFGLILANGFFALSEFSIIASRKSRLKQLINEKKSGAKQAEELRSNSDKFLAGVQVGITLFATLAGVFSGATVVRELEKFFTNLPIEFFNDGAKSLSVAIVAILITMITVVIGELVPKYLALSNPENYARRVSRPISWFIKIISFFSHSLSITANFLLKVFGIRTNKDGSAITEDEINQMIYEGKQKGVFDEIEERLIKSVFDFADSTVRRAMTPRTDVVALNLNASSKEIIDSIVENGYSRFPIYEENIDHIKGVLYSKDIIIHKLNPELIILKDLLHEPLFVPDSMPLSKLLNIFQLKKKHIAVVLDEFGGTAGIITLEDILEELVGEIQDEYDEESPPLVKHSDTIAFAEGSVWPGDINELMNSHLPEDKIDTVAGLVIDTLGSIPKKDTEIIIADMLITVLELDQNRLTRLKLELLPDKAFSKDN